MLKKFNLSKYNIKGTSKSCSLLFNHNAHKIEKSKKISDELIELEIQKKKVLHKEINKAELEHNSNKLTSK